MAKRKYKRLHYEDRQTIEAMSKQGSSVSDIAEVLGTHRDTIYREFKRCNATLKTYTAAAGQQPPYVAVGFRAKKTGGKYRYVWLLKAKFKVPSEKYETKGESIKFNTPDIEASFTTRKKDNLWKADFVGTEESAAAKTWFTAVPEKAAAMESV